MSPTIWFVNDNTRSFCDLLLTLAEKFVVHVSLGLSYDFFFFYKFYS